MVSKEVRLSPKALKLLAEYSEAKGITPSQAVEQLVPKAKKVTVSSVLKKAESLSENQADKLLVAPRTKAMSDREAGKFARDAVRRYRDR